MYRIIVSFITLIACVNLLGCSKGPSDKVVKKLAQGYLSGMVPGISEEEISILKTFEKEGHTIVVVQAGGMTCDMSVIKEKKHGWIAREISCNGQFESQEKDAERKKSFMIAGIKKTVEELNKKVPTMSADGITRTDKYELVNNTVVVYQTNVIAKASEVAAKETEDNKADYLSKTCVKLKELVSNGINYEYNVNDKDGKPLIKHLINSETCSKYP